MSKLTKADVPGKFLKRNPPPPSDHNIRLLIIRFSNVPLNKFSLSIEYYHAIIITLMLSFSHYSSTYHLCPLSTHDHHSSSYCY